MGPTLIVPVVQLFYIILKEHHYFLITNIIKWNLNIFQIFLSRVYNYILVNLIVNRESKTIRLEWASPTQICIHIKYRGADVNGPWLGPQVTMGQLRGMIG